MDGPSPEFIQKIISCIAFAIVAILLDIWCQRRNKKLQPKKREESPDKKAGDSETQLGNTEEEETPTKPEDVPKVGWRDYSRR
tara:strand:- start:699 stop:947 length:249 start_codon:yes stop_codon:yes gene_type:complete